MKKLNQIITYSVNPEWLKNVGFTLVGFKYNEDKKAVQLSLFVSEDRNDYGNETITNMGEKVSFYAHNLRPESIKNLKIGKKARIEKIESVVIWGDRKDSLSIHGTINFNE